MRREKENKFIYLALWDWTCECMCLTYGFSVNNFIILLYLKRFLISQARTHTHAHNLTSRLIASYGIYLSCHEIKAWCSCNGYMIPYIPSFFRLRSFFSFWHVIMKIFIGVNDCRDTRLTLNIMIQQNNGKSLSSTLTENNPVDVWDDDCDGAVLP